MVFDGWLIKGLLTYLVINVDLIIAWIRMVDLLQR